MAQNRSSDDRADPPLADLRRHGYARIWPQLSNQLIALRWSVEDLKLAQSAYALAVELFGTMVRANEAPFLSHTVGTGSILAVHGAPPTIVCGGLLHAGYTHGLYETPPDKPLDRAHRLVIAQRVSPPVELIVRNYRRYRPADMPVPDDANGYDQDHAAVLLVRAANHLEEHLDCGLVYANKMQKQGDEVMQHARILLPSLGYHRLLADLESAERLMADINPAPTEVTSKQIKSRSVSR